jgi:transposase
VQIASETEEAARDLVRAREDARGDPVRALHRLSKLLLRHSLVWDRSTWTDEHTDWLRRERFERRGVQLAFRRSPRCGFTGVNGQVVVPAGGQVKVPGPRGGWSVVR